MCNENLWSRLEPFFDDNYELITLPIPLEDSFDTVIESLEKSIKEEKINLLGFSLGGYIASYFACKYPHRINKLFIIASSLCPLSEQEIKKREDTISFVSRHGFKGLSTKKVISLLDKQNEKNFELIELIQQMYVDLGKEVFLSQMSVTLKRDDLLYTINKLYFPITFLYGSKDRLVNHTWMETLAKVTTHIRQKRFDTTSHMLPLEKPTEVAKEIKNFF